MAHPQFQVKTGKDGKIYFNLTAKNGQIILTSQGYTSKAGCKTGIESVKNNAQKEDRFERKESADGQSFFVLKAGNGETIGKSELYTTKAAMDNGVKSVMTNASEAEIVDVE